MGNDIDELARRGRENSAQQLEAGRNTRIAAAAVLGADLEARAQRSSSVWGLFLSVYGLIFTVLSGCVLGVLASVALGGVFVRARSSGDPPPEAVALSMVVVMVWLAAATGGSWLKCRNAFARQREWVASLPFALLGYEKTLGTPYMDSVCVTIVLLSVPPEPSKLLEAAASLNDPDITASLEGTTLTITHAAVAGRGGYLDSPQTPDTNQNHKFRKWFQGPLFDLVLAIHARYPIKQVSVMSI